MPNKRKVVFANGEVYHVFNKSVASEDIFATKRYLTRAIDSFDYYRSSQKVSFSRLKYMNSEAREDYLLEAKKNPSLVEIYAFSLMPDHFHFLLRQTQDGGIVRFLSTFQNSFAKFYNIHSSREGALFKRPFKSKWIPNDEVLVHLSRYIHLNPVTAYIIEFGELINYPWTSYPYYVGEKDDLIETELVLKLFGNKKEKYAEFVGNQVDYQRELGRIKKYTLG